MNSGVISLEVPSNLFRSFNNPPPEYPTPWHFVKHTRQELN